MEEHVDADGECQDCRQELIECRCNPGEGG